MEVSEEKRQTHQIWRGRGEERTQRDGRQRRGQHTPQQQDDQQQQQKEGISVQFFIHPLPSPNSSVRPSAPRPFVLRPPFPGGSSSKSNTFCAVCCCWSGGGVLVAL
ncbi:hypothetical protein niasHT_019972 [Heterodera trifolii]|uniref:Uncharacterized protein n=1 Tax=Heterodera trifolii TaxID=157864 RepID=A0ABD2LGW6_9BILA